MRNGLRENINCILQTLQCSRELFLQSWNTIEKIPARPLLFEEDVHLLFERGNAQFPIELRSVVDHVSQNAVCFPQFLLGLVGALCFPRGAFQAAMQQLIKAYTEGGRGNNNRAQSAAADGCALGSFGRSGVGFHGNTRKEITAETAAATDRNLLDLQTARADFLRERRVTIGKILRPKTHKLDSNVHGFPPIEENGFFLPSRCKKRIMDDGDVDVAPRMRRALCIRTEQEKMPHMDAFPSEEIANMPRNGKSVLTRDVLHGSEGNG